MNQTTITIDGSHGEGGGQILRSSLTLSMLTGRGFIMQSIRANRSKPGLLRQHLTAIQAAVKVCGAKVEGAKVGSGRITFQPNQVTPGEYHFSIGSAGSATLVLQTILPVLMQCSSPSSVTVEGGTHNDFAPPFDFLQKTYLPQLMTMGFNVSATLQQHGFYPAGGGRITLDIQPPGTMHHLALNSRGDITHRRICGIVSRLPERIACKEVNIIQKRLSWNDDCCEWHCVSSPGPGNVVMVELGDQHLTTVFTGFGKAGVSVEKVTSRVLKVVEQYMITPAAVDPHLADQLLIPMVMVGEGEFTTTQPTQHTITNIQTIGLFIDTPIHCSCNNDNNIWAVKAGHHNNNQ